LKLSSSSSSFVVGKKRRKRESSKVYGLFILFKHWLMTSDSCYIYFSSLITFSVFPHTPPLNRLPCCLADVEIIFAAKRKKYSQFHRFFSEGERRNLLDKYDKKTNEIKLFLFFTLFITYYVAYFLHHHFCRFVESRYIYVFEKEWRRRKRPRKIAEKIFLGFPKFFHVLT
jgi:hypothetical protein